jgi:hypothetical protein
MKSINSICKIANLKYSNPKDKMVCISTDEGYTWKYFSRNKYKSIKAAKKQAYNAIQDHKIL